MTIARVTVMTAAVIAALMQQPGLAMSKTFIVMRGPITKSEPAPQHKRHRSSDHDTKIKA